MCQNASLTAGYGKLSVMNKINGDQNNNNHIDLYKYLYISRVITITNVIKFIQRNTLISGKKINILHIIKYCKSPT